MYNSNNNYNIINSIIIIYNAHKAITKFLIGKIFVLFSYSIEYLLFVYIMNKNFYKLYKIIIFYIDIFSKPVMLRYKKYIYILYYCLSLTSTIFLKQ